MGGGAERWFTEYIVLAVQTREPEFRSPEALEKARYRFIHLYLLHWDWGDTQIDGLADQSV